MKTVLLFLLIPCFVFSSEIPNFNDFSKCNGVAFLLTTPRSGSNLVSGSLSAITRRPISWIRWGNSVFDPSSKRKIHPSYNRLGLPLVTEQPLLYRAHYELDELMQVPSGSNQLIFLTRNPKELLFRAYGLEHPEDGEPDFPFIESFLTEYLAPFRVYDSWNENNKMLVYYEDFIADGNEILLNILHLLDVSPTYFEDFLRNKEQYMDRLLESYQRQHERNKGGLSSRDGPKAIFYSRNASGDVLRRIDDYIAKIEPNIWDRYLKRFASL